jgi:hypothetical protein
MHGLLGVLAALSLASASCGGAPNKLEHSSAAVCEPASFTACGCGCCGGMQAVERCVDTASGQTMKQLIEADQAVARTSNCALAGCSMPVRYTCCPGQ